ncbi:hypothetical protein C1752_03593 [Acaryochloris thomasi RCC1774]|uniref:Glycosyltransferase 2-like domain-containing protein n=1 Tax=Acaryochloris thomasi RCC1774 TaxID=1764569 RepID=A0A2W1JG81_9CYAN|nr:glycosyltransferase family 2 protein [Acaryochloris thomasi]PZD72426.1 hypothetical protein C1752_03593 [Acaryochloris thomasi RCC1774]
MQHTNDLLVFIIIPVHNRKSITFSCLKHLREIGDLCRYQIVVVDDGSTDGTFTMLEEDFPEVTVLSGDGDLWWAGAIVRGMEYAIEHGADYFVWLNDDTFPSVGTIKRMVAECAEHTKIIASAQCYSAQNLQYPTYGGHKKSLTSTRLIFTPKNSLVECDCLSGNLVCFPKIVVDQLGFPPADKLPHCLADIAYTWQAKKYGYRLRVIGDATAVCEFNPSEEGWASSPISMKARWKEIFTLKSNLYPPAFWYFCRKTYDQLALFVFVRMYLNFILFIILRALLPVSILQKIRDLKNILYKDQLSKEFASSFDANSVEMEMKNK